MAMRLRTRNVVLLASALTALLTVPAGAQALTPPAAAQALTPPAAGQPGTPAAAQARSHPGPPPGARGPIITHPTETAFDYPAGEVCAFPSHTEFPVDDLTMKTWVDAAGDPVFATETGPLVQRTTNLDTGETVERNISGDGVITYPDPDSYILSGNDWSAGFHTTDRPVHNKWIIAGPFMSVKITTVNGQTTRSLLALAGPYEDLCKTLS
jgi:hypothetical protein